MLENEEMAEKWLDLKGYNAALGTLETEVAPSTPTKVDPVLRFPAILDSIKSLLEPETFICSSKLLT